MSQEAEKKLSSFMKKQISEKSSKKNLAKKSTPSKPNVDSNQKDAKDKNESSKEEEMSEEEKSEEAKRTSRSKAAQINQSAMIKKLILQNLAKYTLIFAIFSVVTIGIIQFAPAMFKLLNGLVSKVLIGAINK